MPDNYIRAWHTCLSSNHCMLFIWLTPIPIPLSPPSHYRIPLFILPILNTPNHLLNRKTEGAQFGSGLCCAVAARPPAVDNYTEVSLKPALLIEQWACHFDRREKSWSYNDYSTTDLEDFWWRNRFASSFLSSNDNWLVRQQKCRSHFDLSLATYL